uniref:Uncharacterized protein n=1 Tax=Strombidium inclinatum TaxID=197538 RepID=A0A7S3IN13_9SPIT
MLRWRQLRRRSGWFWILNLFLIFFSFVDELDRGRQSVVGLLVVSILIEFRKNTTLHVLIVLFDLGHLCRHFCRLLLAVQVGSIRHPALLRRTGLLKLVVLLLELLQGQGKLEVVLLVVVNP